MGIIFPYLYLVHSRPGSISSTMYGPKRRTCQEWSLSTLRSKPSPRYRWMCTDECVLILVSAWVYSKSAKKREWELCTTFFTQLSINKSLGLPYISWCKEDRIQNWAEYNFQYWCILPSSGRYIKVKMSCLFYVCFIILCKNFLIYYSAGSFHFQGLWIYLPKDTSNINGMEHFTCIYSYMPYNFSFFVELFHLL